MAKKSTNKKVYIVDFFRDKTVQFIVGVVLFFLTIYVSLALISFLYSGKADQSVVAEYNTKKQEYVDKKSHAPLTDADKKELQNIKKELLKIQVKADNITGYRGAVMSEYMINNWLGLGVFFLCAFGFVCSLRLFGVKKISIWKSFLFFIFLTIWTSLLLAFVLDSFIEDSFIRFGGDFGISFNDWLSANLGKLGALLVIVGSGVIFATLAISGTIPFFKKIYSNLSDKKIFSLSGDKSSKDTYKPNTDSVDSVKIGDEIVPEDWKQQDKNRQNTSNPTIIEVTPNKNNGADNDFFVEINTDEGQLIIEELGDSDDGAIVIIEDEENQHGIVDTEPYNPRKDLSQYMIPRFYDKYKDKPLLTDYPVSDNSQNEEEKAANRKKIVETLQKFGIGIKKIYETIGPTITLYEIVPEDGVRINKIRNLADDIMLSLAATGIRIIAPIPGKGTIGIEVPNSKPQIVSMYATIASKKFQESTYDLPVALGRTITNEVFMFDLCKMPHLLVAGATGQGKSVGLNAIITSLLFKKHPSELKFVLIDPKKVEFNIYADIERHFLAKLPDEQEPVITDVEKVKQTLNSLCKEMDSRYDLLKMAHSRNIKEYNEKFISRHLNPLKGHRYLPYIVVIVDEFGDLIMTAGKDVEMPIARIAQLARAVGIHMVIATQRPSVNIITGVIKANFPARIAFKVSSGVDSKTILDGSGAQQLIGRGDMLFSQGNEPTRVQCAFVDTPEVENIVHFIGNQQGYPSAFPLPEPDFAEGGTDKKELDPAKRDSLFEDVARFVVSTQQGSTSNVQRKFEIGFNRAGRIVDQLEAAGIVGPINGSKPRQVLIPTEYELEKLLNS
ncbi:cell division protein FtsK [Porphyromonadaceae bacterium COT-184 OH4590]|nr:cell division protein FtsK [Porphyromonadaceae bacterium COT-184 OH4590]